MGVAVVAEEEEVEEEVAARLVEVTVASPATNQTLIQMATRVGEVVGEGAEALHADPEGLLPRQPHGEGEVPRHSLLNLMSVGFKHIQLKTRVLISFDTCSVSQPSRRTSTVQSASNGARQGAACQCGEPAGERTVTKDGPNKGRKFLTCGKERTCDFFEWLDDASGSGAVNTSANAPKPRSVVPAKRKSSETAVSLTFL